MTDALRTPLSRHRSRRRRGQAHALQPAESAAQGRRAHHARPCARFRRAGRARTRSPWWSGRAATTSPPRPAPPRPTPGSSCRPNGSARPTRCWRRARLWREGFDDVLVLFADTPLVRPETFALLREKLAEGAGVVALGFEPADPAGYGRLLTDKQRRARWRSASTRTPAPSNARSAPVQRRADGARRRAARSAGWSASATPTPRRNIICPTPWPSRGPTAPAAPWSWRQPRKCWASTTAPSSRSRRPRSSAGCGLTPCAAGATLVAPETVFSSASTPVLARRRAGRAACGVRPRRDGRRRLRHPCLLASRRRDVSAKDVSIGPYARLRPGAKLADKARGRQFRRDQAGGHRRGRQGQPSDLYRRRHHRRARQYRRRRPSPAITTASSNIARPSAPTPSSAPIRRWSRRSRSATAPLSARARW